MTGTFNICMLFIYKHIECFLVIYTQRKLSILHDVMSVHFDADVILMLWS
jgi:hypothetical protein